MGHTSKTTNFNLPIVEPLDRPTWSGEFNGLARGVDTALATVRDSVNTFGASVELARVKSTEALETAQAAGAAAAGTQAAVNEALTLGHSATTTASQARDTANSAAASAGASATTAQEAAANIGTIQSTVSNLTTQVSENTSDITAIETVNASQASQLANLIAKQINITNANATTLWGTRSSSKPVRIHIGNRNVTTNSAGKATLDWGFNSDTSQYFTCVEAVILWSVDHTKGHYAVRRPTDFLQGNGCDIYPYWANGGNVVNATFNCGFMIIGQ